MKRMCVWAATAAAVLAIPAAASAAPKPDPTNVVNLTCPGTPYNGLVSTPPGDGNWTPAFMDHTTFLPVQSKG